MDPSYTFEDAFAPVAHHLFPDGCPNWEEFQSVWPQRHDRTTIPYSQAKAALQHQDSSLRKCPKNTDELAVIVWCACYVMSGCSSSPFLIRHFQDFLRCLVPATVNTYLTSSSIQQLMTCRLSNQDRSYLYRFFMVAIRCGVLIESTDMLVSYYPLFFQHCQQFPEAVHIARLLTTRSHACPFRARRLLSWHRAGSVGVYQLLELYAKFDPKGCQKYLPSNDYVTPRFLRFPSDVIWAREMMGHLKSSTLSEPPSKKLKESFLTIDGPTFAIWRGKRQVTTLLQNDALLEYVAVSDIIKDDHILQLRVNLPYILYEDWYISEDYRVEKEEDDSDMEEEIEFPARSPIRISLHGIRLNVLRSMALFLHHLGYLLPEIEFFLVEDVLPIWDGSDEWTLVLCQDLLPYWKPSSYFPWNIFLPYLEPLTRYGSARLQYRILSTLIPQWIRNWGNCADTISLVKWTSAEFKRLFLASDRTELLSLALVDMYQAVLETTSLLPNFTMVYTLYLSRTVVPINALCRLLRMYRSLLLKERAIARRPETEKRIQLYNSYVWDIVSMAWRNKLSPHPNSYFFQKFLPVSICDALRDEPNQSTLSVTHSATFIGYYDSLQEKIRNKAHYIDILKRRGLIEIHAFLVTFVGSLADRERKKKEKMALLHTSSS